MTEGEEPDVTGQNSGDEKASPVPAETGDEKELQVQPASEAPKKISEDQRRKLLAEAIQREVVQGARVQSQSEFQAVMVKGERPNHTLHAIITFFTCGLWGFVWIVIALTGGEKRTMVTVDEWGNSMVQNLGKQ
jgi:hypothetical protein